MTPCTLLTLLPLVDAHGWYMGALVGDCLFLMWRTWHFNRSNSMSQSLSHCCRESRSYWSTLAYLTVMKSPYTECSSLQPVLLINGAHTLAGCLKITGTGVGRVRSPGALRIVLVLFWRCSHLGPLAALGHEESP